MLASLHREALRLNPESCNATLALDKLLAEFQSRRYNRVKSTYLRSRFGARLHTQDDLVKTIIGRYIFPYAGRQVIRRTRKALADAHFIDFLPLPKRLGASWSEDGGHARPASSLRLNLSLIYVPILLPCLLYLIYSEVYIPPVLVND